MTYHNKVHNISKPQLSEAERQKLLPTLDPYNNKLYMPLEQFVDHPIAKELIHNGIFFQVRQWHGWQMAQPAAVHPAWPGCEAGCVSTLGAGMQALQAVPHTERHHQHGGADSPPGPWILALSISLGISHL